MKATHKFIVRLVNTIPAAVQQVELDRPASAIAEAAEALGVKLTWAEALEIARDLDDAGCVGSAGPMPIATSLDEAAAAAADCQRACAGALVGGAGPTAAQGAAFAAAFQV